MEKYCNYTILCSDYSNILKMTLITKKTKITYFDRIYYTTVFCTWIKNNNFYVNPRYNVIELQFI